MTNLGHKSSSGSAVLGPTGTLILFSSYRVRFGLEEELDMSLGCPRCGWWQQTVPRSGSRPLLLPVPLELALLG